MKVTSSVVLGTPVNTAFGTMSADDKARVFSFAPPQTTLTETVVLNIQDYDSMEALCKGSHKLERCAECHEQTKTSHFEPYWAETAWMTDPATSLRLPFKVGERHSERKKIG